MLRRERIFLVALCLLVLVFLCVGASADSLLYRGASSIGAVESFEAGSGLFVSLEDVGRLLGFSSSRSGDEIRFTRGSTTLRAVLNSAVAWNGIFLVPLRSAPFERSGKYWVDAASAAAFFQSSAGSSVQNKLRFNTTAQHVAAFYNAGSGGTSVSSLSELDFGNFDDDLGDISESNNILPDSASTNLITSTTVPQTVQAVQTTNQSSIQEAPLVVPQYEAEKPLPVAVTNNKTNKAGSKAQPKLETFNPGEPTKKSQTIIHSGQIQGIRWSSSQSGTYKKIRAAVDADDSADPQVQMTSDGTIHAFFLSSAEGVDGLPSPYGNVKSEIKTGSGGIELIFSPSGAIKIEKLVLNSPRRIVFDFFFPSNVIILNADDSKTTSAQASTPATATTPVPVITIPKPEEITMPPARNDPVINIPQTIPADTRTVPTIIIPTTPYARKTIVVDPGHGGKDPGASANGVTEKNVNLAIGLELERVLKAQGFNVIMTRRTDVYLKLQERTDIANNARADLFVSVHVNALPSKRTMAGFEIYIMALPTDKDALNLAKIENREYVEGKGIDTENVDQRTEVLLRILGDMQQNNKISESTDFAAALFNAGKQAGLPMRRVAQAPFFVIRGAGMPAVLLETGFVTNVLEAKLLSSPEYQQRIAQAMATGIANYLK